MAKNNEKAHYKEIKTYPVGLCLAFNSFARHPTRCRRLICTYLG